MEASKTLESSQKTTEKIPPDYRRILNPRVCIVGAGVAGLRAADLLLQHGAQVTILEARSRIGGRVDQMKVADRLVDVGPNWLQSGEQDPISKIVRETSTVLHSWSDQQKMFGQFGTMISDSEVDELQEVFWQIVHDAFTLSEDQDASIEPTQSLQGFVRTQAQTKFIGQPTQSKSRKRRLVIQIADMWGAFVGNPVDEQSLKFCWLEKSVEGEEAFVAGTFAEVLKTIAKPAIEKADLRHWQEVDRIINQDDSKVEVVTTDRKSDTFDEVIVTVPLGCLKANKPAFSPPLPERLRQAIASIGYGSLDKVYISFPRAFWQQRPKKARIGDKPFPGIIYWLSPAYTLSTNPEKWTQVCVNLATLPPALAQPTLLFYTYGPCSQRIADIVSGTLPHKISDVVFEFFRPYIALLPNYAPSNPDCQPAELAATVWRNDQYAGHGSYSNFQVGLERGDEDIVCMREGLPDRHIWLAGEHTAPFSSLGTVSGAYQSGEEVAKRIIESWKNNAEKPSVP